MDEDESPDSPDLTRYYYLELAAAYVRGAIPGAQGSSAELFRQGIESGLRLHRFKRTQDLPRVRKVIGILRGLAPDNLLDIGSGRGVFLWPLLDGFPDLHITAVDRAEHRVADLEQVRAGGISRLDPQVGDIINLEFPERSFDVVTVLEVLEHLPQPEAGVRELIRLAKRFIVASVPSKPDENPEHLHLFTAATLSRLFEDAALAAGRTVAVRCEYVLNHIVAVVSLGIEG